MMCTHITLALRELLHFQPSTNTFKRQYYSRTEIICCWQVGKVSSQNSTTFSTTSPSVCAHNMMKVGKKKTLLFT